ncbi:MAG: hypothetical protein MJZ34_07910, partial [Paludibacteraceae bacterium]|nr:hypothetical protein [Paludibacteraceae bacterium]
MIESAKELMFLLMKNSIIFEHICTFNKGLNKNTYYLTASNNSTYILIEKYQDDKDLLVEQYYDDILQNIESISNKLFISYPLTLDTLKQIDLLINPNTDVENVIYVDLEEYDWKDSTEKWCIALETIKDTPMEEIKDTPMEEIK